MTFSPFHRRHPADGPGDPQQDRADRTYGADRTDRVGPPPPQPPAERRDWRESGIADEVTAFLEGRYVDHLVIGGQPVPAWSALNRVAHADHRELVELVGGSGFDRSAHPSRRLHAWAEDERFLAAHLLATSGATPDGLVQTQLAVLIPVELSLIERSKVDQFRPEDVLQSASEALDRYRTGA